MWAPIRWNRVVAAQYSPSPTAPPCATMNSCSKKSWRLGRSGPTPAVSAANASSSAASTRIPPALSADGALISGRANSEPPQAPSATGTT